MGVAFPDDETERRADLHLQRFFNGRLECFAPVQNTTLHDHMERRLAGRPAQLFRAHHELSSRGLGNASHCFVGDYEAGRCYRGWMWALGNDKTLAQTARWYTRMGRQVLMEAASGLIRDDDDEMMAVLSQREIAEGHQWFPIIFGTTPLWQTYDNTDVLSGWCPGLALVEPVRRAWPIAADRICMSRFDPVMMQVPVPPPPPPYPPPQDDDDYVIVETGGVIIEEIEETEESGHSAEQIETIESGASTLTGGRWGLR